jgi:flagellar hook protein FlgE
MMRSMFSGVSGLRAHQTRMDVIGNNIANVNTVGFKSGRVTFQEIFSQTIRGAAAPDTATGRGGTNPMQVGLGISVASIDTIHTRGSLQRTDNPTDLAIDGEGFFIVKGGDSDTYRFTRAGNFGIDKLGNLVTADGMNVYGWDRDLETGGFDTEKSIKPINIYTGKRIISAKETSKAVFEGNLDASYKSLDELNAGSANDAFDNTSVVDNNTIDTKLAAGGTNLQQFSVPYTVYDKLGNDYTLTLHFVKNNVDDSDSTNPKTQWFWYVRDQGSYDAATDGTKNPAQGYVTFDKDGKIVSGITFDSSGTAVNGLVQKIMIDLKEAEVGTADFTVDLDFSNLTQFKADGSVKATDVNGYGPGKLVTFNIGTDGIITGIYSNGQQQALGMIALAFFENPAGLQKVGSNLYIPTTNSGDFKKGLKPGSEGVGTLSPGTLEMSNVDLSREFTEMITTQRGFQANSRIITTSDEMLQELVNLKR